MPPRSTLILESSVVTTTLPAEDTEVPATTRLTWKARLSPDSLACKGFKKDMYLVFVVAVSASFGQKRWRDTKSYAAAILDKLPIAETGGIRYIRGQCLGTCSYDAGESLG